MFNYLEVPTNYESAWVLDGLATLNDEFVIPPPIKKVGMEFNNIHKVASFLGILT